MGQVVLWGSSPINKREREMMEPIDAAKILLTQCEELGVTTRLLGGLGVYFVSPSAALPPFQRMYNDVDVVIPKGRTRQFTEAAVMAGYEPDKRFNALQGDKRLLFHLDDMPLDVFVGVFEQCHTMDLEPRFPKALPSIAIEDLLLTKMQVIQITAKDMNDSLALLQDHALGSTENNVNVEKVSSFLAADWGWYTTVTDNLGKLSEWAAEVKGIDGEPLIQKIRTILDDAEKHPKSLKWKMRAKVGRRIPWYQMPEEKAR